MELNKKNVLKILFIICGSILFFLLIQNFKETLGILQQFLGILTPFLIGFSMAFILNVPMKFFENKVFKGLEKKNNKIWMKVKRPVCLLLSIITVLGVLTIFMLLIIPEIRNSIINIVNELPGHMDNFRIWINGLFTKYDLSIDSFYNLNIDWQTISAGILDKFGKGSTTVINTTTGFITMMFGTLFDIVLGVVFCIYLLSSKEVLGIQFKKLFYSFFKKETSDKILRILTLSSDIFSKFVVGQCTEAVILGVLCYIGMLIFSMPYSVMTSSLIAITALIPVFGAFIGTAVGAIMIALLDPIKALWFVVFIIILQQFETNVIYPKVVGQSVGLPGIWVLMAVTIGGSLFGGVGLLLSVPLCSVLYFLLKEFINNRLIQRKINI